jgi:hypothetical protein
MASKYNSIEKTLLSDLYDAHFQGNPARNQTDLQAKYNWDNITFIKAVTRLQDEQLIELPKLGPAWAITSWGIDRAEELGLVDQSLIHKNQLARYRILNVLKRKYDEHGPTVVASIEEVLHRLDDGSEALVQANLNYLMGWHRDIVEMMGGTSLRIKQRGVDMVDLWESREQIIHQFEDLINLPPQQRGRMLQRLVGELLDVYGWAAQEGVRRAHEEMDVIVSRGREYYPIECKWEKERIEAGVVRELSGKLLNRLDVRGIIMSMSGFTSGAVEQAVEHSNQRLILLFGEQDIRDLFEAIRTFEEFFLIAFENMLDEKYNAMVTSRKAVWK